MRSALLAPLILITSYLPAQDSTGTFDEAPPLNIDWLIAGLTWRTGPIDLADGVASMNVPATHKFLSHDQGCHLLVDVWENPPSITEDLLGVIIQADADVYSDLPAYVVYYEESGYVHDRDADAIDYEAKLRDMLRDDSLANISRQEQGYGALQLIGWASPPYYDKERKAQKRAQILEAEGYKQSLITNSEGDKQWKILQAEGERESQILRAQGEANAKIAIAEAEAKRMELESNAAVEYFKGAAVTKEQLKVIEGALGQNTKYILDSDILAGVSKIFGGTK